MPETIGMRSIWIVVAGALVLPGRAHASGGLELKVVRGVNVEWMGERLTASGDQGEHAACDPPFDEERAPFLTLLASELERYPESIAASIGLRRIVLCRDLAVRFPRPVERTRAGVTDIREEQSVSAFASYREGTIYVDVARAFRSQAHSRKMVHHELFHFLDRAHGGRRDREWMAACPQAARYGSGGLDMQDAGGTGRLRAGLPCFVSEYAQASLAEDKAAVYAHLVVERAQVQALATHDRGIAQKIAILRAILSDVDKRLAGLIDGGREPAR
jgi:hypothetical protein